MEVLRANYQTILTILEVLLYDPLYDWTVSHAEANKRQLNQDDSELENIAMCSNNTTTESERGVSKGKQNVERCVCACIFNVPTIWLKCA